VLAGREPKPLLEALCSHNCLLCFDFAPSNRTQVLDYQHSQRTLFPLLATAYAFHFTGEYMKKMYYQFEKASRQSGDFSALPELHATSSGLKAWCTWKTKDGLELSRLVSTIPRIRFSLRLEPLLSACCDVIKRTA
jgi:hypothetical protein